VQLQRANFKESKNLMVREEVSLQKEQPSEENQINLS
jgi:hypothetical protein